MQRVDLYKLIHKAQRHHLCRLLDDFGRAGDGTQELASLQQRLDDLLAHLHAHAAHEETYIHPFLVRIAPQAEAELRQAHHQLDKCLAELKDVSVGVGPNTYPALARFMAEYFAHMDREEELQRTVLWPHATDADLLSIMAAFQAGQSAEAAATNLAFMLPAMNPAEVAQVSGARSSAPAR